jgi:hypothetical protein
MRCALVLLLSFAVLPVPLACASDKGDEAAAIAKIEGLGGRIARQSEEPSVGGFLGSLVGIRVGQNKADDPVITVSLIGCEKLKDEDLRCLQSFPALTQLFLGRTSTSDAGLKHVAGLKHLSRLGLIGTKITDAGLKHLTGLQELRELYVGNAAITDAGLPEIARLKNLRGLILDGTAVTDAGLKPLAALPKLSELDLGETKITDAGLRELKEFPALRELSLNGTAISDAGLAELGKLQKLTVLDLSGTKITDAGLQQLGGLKTLRRLIAAETKVTDGGVKRLNEGLPGAKIVRHAGGQRADPNFDVSVPHPAYTDKHPTVLFDEAHRNFHTATGRYKVFADLITNDGYRVTPNREPLTAERLAKFELFVSANAPGTTEPSKSAFTVAECDAVENWVRGGGALLLITDHEPFGSGSAELGKRFGVDMSLKVSVDPANETQNGLLFSRKKNQLGDHAILRGRNEAERVNRVLTFTGQSLKGPPGSVQLLKFADTAIDVGGDKRVSAAGRAQGIAFKFGRGRVVVMGEAGDLSAQVYGDPPEPMGMNVPGCDNRKLALNMVHWLSGLID